MVFGVESTGCVGVDILVGEGDGERCEANEADDAGLGLSGSRFVVGVEAMLCRGAIRREAGVLILRPVVTDGV